MPDELWQWVSDGVLQVHGEKPEEKTLWLSTSDGFELDWIHPQHNAEFCHSYQEQPGDLPNFYLRKVCREHGDEDIDMPTLDDLLSWLADKSQACK